MEQRLAARPLENQDREGRPASGDEGAEKAPWAMAAVAACILAGAHVLRVHDVVEMRAAADVADEILHATSAAS